MLSLKKLVERQCYFQQLTMRCYAYPMLFCLSYITQFFPFIRQVQNISGYLYEGYANGLHNNIVHLNHCFLSLLAESHISEYEFG